MEFFPRYEKYKESGQLWLDKIPEHWRLPRLEAVFRERAVAIDR